MATCEELAGQAATMRSQLQDFDVQIAQDNTDISIETTSCIALDTAGGTLPDPINTTTVQQRITDLQNMMSTGDRSILIPIMGAWCTLLNMLWALGSLQSQRLQVQLQLNDVVLAELNQGCLN